MSQLVNSTVDEQGSPSAVRKAGRLGGALSLVAAGTALGLAIQRQITQRIKPHGDAAANEQFGALRADRHRTVTTDDGIPLQVEEVGPADAPLTVVFVHGYCLNMGCWHYQRRELVDMRSPRVRMIFYDQRSHGKSGVAPSGSANIDQLGRDLYTVVEELAPKGPIVLIGHSMGGMTVMALADQSPELFGTRIIGVALLSTSTGKLTDITLGLPALFAKARNPFVPLLVRGMKRRSKLVERSRQLSSAIANVITHRLSFGSTDVSPTLRSYVDGMIAATPVDVIADFFPALTSHDKLAALGVLSNVETLILVGDKDLMTPLGHSVAMHQVLPEAQFVVIPNAAHLVMLERHELVNLRLRAFIHRSWRSTHPTHRRHA